MTDPNLIEAIELLEEAKRNLFQCDATRLIDQALILLKNQPEPSEFTNKTLKEIATKLCNVCPVIQQDANPYFRGKVCFDRNYPSNENCRTLIELACVQQHIKALQARINELYGEFKVDEIERLKEALQNIITNEARIGAGLTVLFNRKEGSIGKSGTTLIADQALNQKDEDK